MQPMESIDNKLDDMWRAHSEFLRRFLISVTRDIDLADDLLQESYVKARSGIETYRGGEPRAWLTAIAKSAFNTHLRRRYVWCESSLDDESDLASGTTEHALDLLQIRQALSALPQLQRDALIMKHYGGYSYEDIAAHMSCPLGTAKSRVSLAIRRLREALVPAREESDGMICADLSERALLDFIYGRTPEDERKRTEEHLAECGSCRTRADEIGAVLRALDAVEADAKGTGIIELHEDGMVTVFLFVTYFSTGEVRETLDFGGDFETINSVLVNGEEAVIEPVPGQESKRAKLRLASPIAAGERVEFLMTGRHMSEETEEEAASGLRKMGPASAIFDIDIPFVMAVRLPAKARLVSATPKPTEVRGNGGGAKTIIWRKVHQPNEEFRFAVEYRMGS